jgi:Mn2+/Fe2+ NRAMP family transporter
MFGPILKKNWMILVQASGAQWKIRKRRLVIVFIVAPCISISIFQEKPTNALIFSVFKNTH